MSKPSNKSYYKSVFINCPFDDNYTPLFRAIIFSIYSCNFYARCTQEEEDSSEIRLTKIFRMISECRFGIHDLSRTEVDRKTHLPRFNMPLELGIFLGAKYYGRDEQDRKVCVIFERTPHSYNKFISDVKGQDIATHENKPELLIRRIRDWLSSNSGHHNLPGGHSICMDYKKFSRWLPKQCLKERLRDSELTYTDYANLVYKWIEHK